MGNLTSQTRVRYFILIFKMNDLGLSDMHSTELAKCIRVSGGYVKTLNLSKNRITDEGL